MPGWRGRADARAGNGAPADATVVDPRAYRFREGRARSGPRGRGRRDDNRRGIRRRGRRVIPDRAFARGCLRGHGPGRERARGLARRQRRRRDLGRGVDGVGAGEGVHRVRCVARVARAGVQCARRRVVPRPARACGRQTPIIGARISAPGRRWQTAGEPGEICFRRSVVRFSRGVHRLC